MFSFDLFHAELTFGLALSYVRSMLGVLLFHGRFTFSLLVVAMTDFPIRPRSASRLIVFLTPYDQKVQLGFHCMEYIAKS